MLVANNFYRTKIKLVASENCQHDPQVRVAPPGSYGCRLPVYRQLQAYSHNRLRSVFFAQLVTWVMLLSLLPCIDAQTSSFTFQGRLTDGGGPATGLYSFRFTLMDAASEGSLIGSPFVAEPVPVENGLFTVVLDFGPSAFDGSPRWIEVAARTNRSEAAYSILAPRTSVSTVPYALRSASASVDAMSAQIAALSAQLLSISNHFATNIPVGVPVVSSDPADPGLLAQGLQLFQTLPAPAWQNGNGANAPSGRSEHASVWTGQQFLVWGGDQGGGSYSAAGGAYTAASDLWQSFSTFQAPTARAGHRVVWTGAEMIVWGGLGSNGYPIAGGRYHLEERTWGSIATAGSPTARNGHAAVWTGSRMVVWSGRNASGLLADGGSYSPSANTWTALPVAGAPAGRRFATAVWTGSAIVFWGGQGVSGELNTGGSLLCDANGVPGSWTSVSTIGAPSARSRHSVVWTGTKMIVWGGQQSGVFLGDGAAYDPANDSWTALPTAAAPAPRANHVAVWTGSELLVYGGEDGTGALSSGGALDLTKNVWRTLDTAAGAVPRAGSTGAWSGSQLIIFGGLSGGTPIANLQRLTPQPAFYFFRKP